MTTPSITATKVEDQSAAEAVKPVQITVAELEGDDFDLGGACGLDPNDPEFEGCTACQ